MTPANRSFVRRVRKLARRELKTSKGAWKEYKRSRHSWRENRAYWSVPVLSLFVFGALLRTPPESVALALALYGLGTVLRRGQIIAILLNHAEPNYFFLHHPIPDRTVFRSHMSAVLWSSMWSLLVFAIGLGLIYRVELEFATTWQTIAASAILMWVACLGGILATARLVPPKVSLIGAYVLYGSALLVPAMPESLVPYLHHLLVLTPVGAITYFLAQYRLHGDLLPVSLVPAVGFVVALPWLFVQAARSFSSDPLAEQLFGGRGVDDVERDAAPWEEVGPGHQVPEAPSAEFVSHLVRASFDTTRQREDGRWLNRLIDRRLSAREQVVYRFLCGGICHDWAWNWERGSRIAVVTLVLAAIPAAVPAWVIWVAGSLATMFALPLFGGAWPGFADVLSSSKLSPFYAGFPIGFREITAVLLKVNLVRILVWVPGVVVVGLCIGKASAVPLSSSLMAICEFVYGVIVFQLLTIPGKCSAGSDDSKRLGWKRTPIVIATWGFGVGFAAAWLQLFSVDGMLKLAFAGAMAIAAIIAYGLYRFGYENDYWDLVKV